MNPLNEIINRSYPGARLSCRECGSHDVMAVEDANVSMSNPLGERMMLVKCQGCGLTDEAINATDVPKTVKKWLIKTVTLYTCSFEHKNLDCKAESKFFPACNEGFWINAAGNVTNGSDRAVWIPPGKINHIELKAETKRLSE